MNIKDKFKLYIKGKNDKYNIEEIVNNLPDNQVITKDTLNKLKNSTTKMISDEDIKGNYYVFLNDTIYLSTKNTKKYNRLTVICHECVHSIQNKTLQLINFVLSNIEIIAFVILFALKIFNILSNISTYLYIGIVIVSVIPRIILEIDASLKSIKLTKEYVNEKIGNNEAEFVNKIVNFQVKAMLPLLLIDVILWKIIRIIFMSVI